MILLRSFLSGHIRIKRTLEYYDAGIGPRVPFGGGFGPTVSVIFATALGDYTTLSSVSSMPTGGDVSRAGNAMLYDATGKLTYAPNNLLLSSNAFNNATDWQKITGGTGVTPVVTGGQAGPFGGANASRLQIDRGAGNTVNDYSLLRQYVTGTTTAIRSVWVKSNTSSSQTFLLIGQVIPSLVTATTSWTQVYYASSLVTEGLFDICTQGTYGTTANLDILVYNAVCASITYETAPRSADANPNSSGVPQPTTTSAYYGPRFDYDPVTLAAKGLLVEGARTNLVSVVSGWTTTSCSFTGASLSGPDGTNVTPVTVTGTPTFIELASASISKSASALPYAVSIYVKAGTIASATGTLRLRDNATVSNRVDVVFNTTTMSVTSTTASGTFGVLTNCTSTSVGDGWYRFAFVVLTSTETSINARVYIGGSPTGTIYLWGAQVEQANFVSSFIPNGSTRAAETLTLTGYTNRLVEAFYIDEQTNAASSYNVNASSTSPLTIINTGTTTTYGWGWYTSLRAYTNAYAGDIASPSWLSFSRAGNAMYYDSTGALTWAPANLVKYSQDFSKNASGEWVDYWAGPSSRTANTTAVTDPLGGNTVTRLVLPSYTSNQTPGVVQYTASTAGRKVISSVWARGASGGEIIAISGDDTNFTSYTLTTSWQRISNVVSGGASQMDIVSYLGSSGASQTIYLWGAQSELATYQQSPRAYIPTTSAAVYQPRYDYDPSTTPATPRGMLIEEQRVNLISLSQAISTWGSNSGFTPTANAAIAPDGTQTASLMVPSATAPYMLRQGTIASTVCTASVYAKATGSTNRWLSFTDFGASSSKVWFDLYNGVVGTVTAVYSGSITYVGNGWYRCVFSQTAAAANPYIEMHVSNANTSTTAVVDGVSGIYLWGAQLEAGSFATSYIPTVASSVTRAADVAQLTGSALTTLQGTQMTLAAEAVSSVATNRYLINARKISGGNYGDYYSLGSLSSEVNVATVNQATLTYIPAPTTTTIFRAAFAIKANDFAAVANNGTVQTDGTGSIVTGIDQGWLGGYSDGVYLNGYVRSMALYNQRLPDAILKQKSSVNAPY